MKRNRIFFVAAVLAVLIGLVPSTLLAESPVNSQLPFDLPDENWMGGAVAISNDVLVAGTPHFSFQRSGQETETPPNIIAQVFRKGPDDRWVLEASLTNESSVATYAPGKAVAIFDNVVAVGAPDSSGSEAVFIYRYNGSEWRLETVLKPESGVASTGFGSPIAVYDDIVITGSPEDGELGENAGAAYVVLFSRDDGTTWTPVDILDRYTDTSYDWDISSQPPGTQYRIKVIATDGVNTGMDVSDAVFTIENEEPTAVELVSFTVTASDRSVVLAWETGTELDNAGFHLHRATSADGPYTRITDGIIGAKGDAHTGAAYTFTDRPGVGFFYYKLEDVDTEGISMFHGPVGIQAATPVASNENTLYLPRLSRD